MSTLSRQGGYRVSETLVECCVSGEFSENRVVDAWRLQQLVGGNEGEAAVYATGGNCRHAGSITRKAT